MSDVYFFFFFKATAPTEIYTLSLHDALPICWVMMAFKSAQVAGVPASLESRFKRGRHARQQAPGDRKSTRLNSSHVEISYAVFCLKKKKEPDCELRIHLRPDVRGDDASRAVY